MIIEIGEEQRQVMLMGLAHLAMDRPGWDNMIEEIAGKLEFPGLGMYMGVQGIADSKRHVGG